MSKFKDADFRKQLSSIFIKLAERIEQDEQFAHWLFEGTTFLASDKSSKRKKMSPVSEQQSVPLDKRPLPDIYTIYSKEGAEALRDLLYTYETETLKEMVLENGLDPVRKVRRWKTRDKILAYIIEVVSKQMSKGKAFMDES
ncbi:hypothetical protein SAMN04487897_1174 [Paenibacillus sp. yr247]|uniref:hypothetical protein n=1 Tax=Paenibacillus sp. yr247 TaxID=1761880 RepID=UPI0008819A8E|nr:hypothetical protein [Paenibacillus sp. yr247]SDO56851.1 hypothetical protein SAMN04487897_1174 [Paenibacillus sp. yr247]